MACFDLTSKENTVVLVFRKLDEIMNMICYSHDFYDPLSSLKNWCYMGQRIISMQHSTMQYGKIQHHSAPRGCQSSTSKFCVG